MYAVKSVEIAGLWGEAPVSSAEEHFLDMEGVTSSILVPPTSLNLQTGTSRGLDVAQLSRRLRLLGD